MNKLLMISFAICLVSVHAFVKRDTPEAPSSEKYVDSVTKQLENLTKDINDKIKDAFSPEVMKTRWNEALEDFNKALESLKATDTPK